MGDLLGSPRGSPLFLAFTGTILIYHMSFHWGSALPIAIGVGRSSIRASDQRYGPVEIARLRFLPVFYDMEDPIFRGRSAETTTFLDGRGDSYGQKRLGGGGGGGGGLWAVSARACNMRGKVGVGHGTGDNQIVALRNGGFKRTATQEHDGCNHTSTNAPDPIRTPQLSVFERE